MTATTIDWNEIGALIGGAGLLLTLIVVPTAKWVIRELRQNRETIDAINTRVTTPDTVPGTIGQTVAQMAVDSDAHRSIDDARFTQVWRELGKPEPPFGQHG
jgi:hypothetical protein